MPQLSHAMGLAKRLISLCHGSSPLRPPRLHCPVFELNIQSTARKPLQSTKYNANQPSRPYLPLISPFTAPFRRLLSTASSSPPPPPTVASRTVQITFLSSTGSRLTVPCLLDASLYWSAVQHGIDLGPTPSVGDTVSKVHNERWTEDLFGGGPTSGYDHVILPPAYHAAVNPRSPEEVECLEGCWDAEEIGVGSRLASQVRVSEGLDGATIYVPDGVPDNCP